MTINREPLLDKIRALMAKTVDNGCTEAEALAALDKARAMMDAYEVTEADLQLSKAETAVLRREPPGSKDPHKIKAHLASAVARFCDCKVWRSGDGLTFCGLPSDARFATWLLDNLTAFVQRELVSHLIGSLAAGHERRLIVRSFAFGCCARVSQRLDALCAQSVAAQSSNGRALVVVKSQAIADKLRELGIVLGKSRASRSTIDGAAYRAGQAAGDRATFGRPVTGANAALRLK